MSIKESEFVNHIISLLQKEGFTDIQKEFKVPERYRVDLLVIKDCSRFGIEVKLDSRRIKDDISKAWKLHKLPEFDYIYVFAPCMHFDSELISYAKQAKIGLAEVTRDSIEWLQESEKLPPAVLNAGWSFSNQIITPGSIFEVAQDVRNAGEKTIRNLKMFFIPSEPFVASSPKKSYVERKSLSPGNVWRVPFKIKVQNKTKKGQYPLYISCTAENVKQVEHIFNIEIGSSERGVMELQ